MDKRERYFASMRRAGVDRLPTMFRSSKVLARRVMAHFGIEPCTGLPAARALLAYMGADFWASGSRPGYYATFVPRYLGPRPRAPEVEDGSFFYQLGIPAVQGQVDEVGFSYPMFCAPPLAGAESPADIPPGFLTARLDLFDFAAMVNKQGDGSEAYTYESLRAGGQDIICMGVLNNFYMICCYLRGMEQFLMDLAWNRPLAERLIGEVGEFCLEYSRRQLARFGAMADCYCGWDDVAGQNGLMFAPGLFRQYFQPLYRRLIDEAKRYGLLVSWHCCGSVHGILPAMIEAGIDVLDVVQTSARDMDLETMYRRYGQDIAFSGGIDVQQLLVFGTPEQVRDEARRARDLWGERGGLLLGPSHEMVPETPIENVLAMYQPAGGTV